MTDKRKVLFTYGASDDFQLIITDAPEERIKEWCVKNYQNMEREGSRLSFDFLKTEYYVLELYDSGSGENDDIEIIGYDEVYDSFHVYKEWEKEIESIKFVYKMESPGVEELITALGRYKDKKLVVSGADSFYIRETAESIMLDVVVYVEAEKNVTLELADGTKFTAPAAVDLTPLGFLDKLEYEVWKLLLKYMKKFGIVLLAKDEPDWTTVKEVQDKILEVFKEAGVNFRA